MAVKSKSKSKSAPVGRPTIYKEEYCQKLIDHMAKGKGFETFGYSIGVARDRVYEWAKKHPEFAEAKKLAIDASLDHWENLGLKGIWHGGRDQPNFNSTVYIFTMKNRFKWTDKVETTVTQTAPFQLAYNPYEDLNDGTADNE